MGNDIRNTMFVDWFGTDDVFVRRSKPETEAEKKVKTVFDLNADCVKNIYVDEIEKVVTVVFVDGSREVVKCGKDDDFDIAVGAALGISRRIFGHTGFYKHIVAKKTKYVKRLENDYDLYCNWCKENHKRKINEFTFKKNKKKYLVKMKGEK